MPTRHAFLANPLPRPHVAPTPTPPDPTPVQSALAKLQLQLQLSHHASLHRYLRPISAPSSSYINPIHPTPAFLSSRSISPSPSPNPHLQKIENRKSNIKNPKMTSYIPPTRPPPSVLIAQACVLPPPPSPPLPTYRLPLSIPPTDSSPDAERASPSPPSSSAQTPPSPSPPSPPSCWRRRPSQRGSGKSCTTARNRLASFAAWGRQLQRGI